MEDFARNLFYTLVQIFTTSSGPLVSMPQAAQAEAQLGSKFRWGSVVDLKVIHRGGASVMLSNSNTVCEQIPENRSIGIWTSYGSKNIVNWLHAC